MAKHSMAEPKCLGSAMLCFAMLCSDMLYSCCPELLMHAKIRDKDWILDSGASVHMCNDLNLLHKLSKSSIKTVTAADHNRIAVQGEGEAILSSTQNSSDRIFHLRRVLYIPQLTANLVSTKAVEYQPRMVVRY
ncbi:hypothetical protein TSAR_015348 [Trichomalopsis sarcophagae]|uniref:Retrovirus-related Pol polyprotein from transposon TNT 1-94-like beta-barrel domain-containing protein n=1 Tax=Trichomalopsis sarcophagae TaxID=543379 RepID=A0A232EDH5_9HYME|nr:hypothetical protein TSAR_015348 [Trichomalopsis sarcophagae]